MMDLKEIIKWFIPCFHILLLIFKSKDLRLTFICLFLLFNFRIGCAANVKSGVAIVEYNAKNVDSLVYNNKLKVNQSDVFGAETQLKQFSEFPDVTIGRTFGRPFKKMMGAMLPLIFQIGAASTWAVVAALVGVKTLMVTLVILKILLIAGAAKTLAELHKAAINDTLRGQGVTPAYYGVLTNNMTSDKKPAASEWLPAPKVGALFGSKGHGHYQHNQGWEPPHPPQKEIHLHIHNNGHHETHEESVPAYGSWSREDATNLIDSKNNVAVVDPYSVGPQTIRTPFGNYVKLDSNNPMVSTKLR